MKRRHGLLAAGAALAAPYLWPRKPHAAASEAARGVRATRVLLWTADDVVVVAPSGDAEAQPAIATPLPSANLSLAPGVAPAVARDGIWLAGRDGVIGFWPCAAGIALASAPLHRHQLPAAVDALGCSRDGRWAIAGAAGAVHLVDRIGTDTLVRAGLGRQGEALGRVRTIVDLPHRRSVLVDWDAGREWWELSLDPAAAPVFDGLVHDYRMGEAIGRSGYRYPRRLLPIEAGNAAAPRLVAAPRGQPWALAHDQATLSVVHLDVRRTIFRWAARKIDTQCVLTSQATDPSKRLWVAADGRLLVFTPPRWAAPAEHPLPGPLRTLALSPRGDALWALSGTNADVGLYERPLDAESTHGWHRVDLEPGDWFGFACHEQRALAAMSHGPRRDDPTARIAWFAVDGTVPRMQNLRLRTPVLGASTLEC